MQGSEVGVPVPMVVVRPVSSLRPLTACSRDVVSADLASRLQSPTLRPHRRRMHSRDGPGRPDADHPSTHTTRSDCLPSTNSATTSPNRSKGKQWLVSIGESVPPHRKSMNDPEGPLQLAGAAKRYGGLPSKAANCALPTSRRTPHVRHIPSDLRNSQTNGGRAPRILFKRPVTSSRVDRVNPFRGFRGR